MRSNGYLGYIAQQLNFTTVLCHVSKILNEIKFDVDSRWPRVEWTIEHSKFVTIKLLWRMLFIIVFDRTCNCFYITFNLICWVNLGSFQLFSGFLGPNKYLTVLLGHLKICCRMRFVVACSHNLIKYTIIKKTPLIFPEDKRVKGYTYFTILFIFIDGNV